MGWGVVRSRWFRTRPQEIRRVLIAHNLLLGDTIMLTPLLAALRARYPRAQVVMTCHPHFLPLFAPQPYGVIALPFDPREPQSLRQLKAHGPYDLGIVPAESRHGWLARAAGARWVIGFPGEAWYYRLSLDEPHPWPTTPHTVADAIATLIGPPGHYDPAAWPAPTARSYRAPTQPYVILHLGAGSPLKYWPPDRWRALAQHLTTSHNTVVLSAGPGQSELIDAVDPTGQYLAVAGTLDLADLWHLWAGASLLIAPDTGVTHLAKLTQTPTVALFGPGQAALYGPGTFFAGMRYQAVTVSAIPCRDESVVFGQSIGWVKTCVRPTAACHFEARCTQAIDLKEVLASAYAILQSDAGHDRRNAVKAPSSTNN